MADELQDAPTKIFDLLSTDPEFAGAVEDGGESEDFIEDDEVGEEPEGEAPEEDDDAEYDTAEDDEEQDDEQTDDEPLYEVKIDGEVSHVTLDEALAGYQRQQAFTKKTQALAEERKTLEALTAQRSQERDQYAQRLQVLENALKEMTPAEPDWDALRDRDPVKYAREYADYQREQERLRAVRAEAARVQQDQMAEYQGHRTQVLREEAAKLKSAVSEWENAEVAKADTANMVKYATEVLGYEPDVFDNILDHRPLLMLRKAMLYDQMQQKRQNVGRKPKTRTTLKPGSPNSVKSANRKGRDAARQRLRQTGSKQDAAAAIFDLLGQE